MATQTVEALIEGGKASAAPPLGPALGPLGVNIGQVIAEINRKTTGFQGMQVPIKVVVDIDTKAFNVTVGTPPVSQLVKKEAGIEKGSSNPFTDKVAELKIEQIIKIAKMKEDALTGKTLKERVKEVIGTCNSMGVLVEEVPAKDAIKLVNSGRFDNEIKEEKTELSAEERKLLEAEKKKLAEDIEKRRAEYEAKAKQLIAEMSGRPASAIRSKLRELKIPEKIITELMPEAKEAPAAGAGKK